MPRRGPSLSSVAGVVARDGRMRVVVTQLWRMRFHTENGERLFVLPDVKVREPVPWDDIPPLIERVRKHVTKSLAPTNHCGECTACCFTLYIKDGEFKKPSYRWCNNCVAGFGCGLYHLRPSVCRSFECLWLKSQKRNDQMPPELRPDRCGVIFTDDTQTNDPLIIECHGEPNDTAWQWIDEMQRVGYKVKKVTHYVDEDSGPR